MNKILSISSLFTSLIFSSCDKTSPQCIPGTVVGTTCAGGYLIQVDEEYSIGQPLEFKGDGGTGNPLPGPTATPATYTNVIEVFSLHDPNIMRGKQLYFQLREAEADGALPNCNVSVIHYTVPQFTVTNYSDTSCYTFATE